MSLVKHDYLFPYCSRIKITSSLIGVALGVEPASTDVMNHPPQTSQSLFDWELIIDIKFYGIILGVLSLGSFIDGFFRRSQQQSHLAGDFY